MNSGCQNLCPNCQYRTVEFVISFGGPDRVTSGHICGLDLPGYPEKTSCIGYEQKNRVGPSLPRAMHYPGGVAYTASLSR
jgi:hypothetical protein